MILREHFQQRFAELQTQLQLNDETLARILGISLPTVACWRNGEAAPHPVARENILRALRRRAGIEDEVRN